MDSIRGDWWPTEIGKVLQGRGRYAWTTIGFAAELRWNQPGYTMEIIRGYPEDVEIVAYATAHDDRGNVGGVAMLLTSKHWPECEVVDAPALESVAATRSTATEGRGIIMPALPARALNPAAAVCDNPPQTAGDGA